MSVSTAKCGMISCTMLDRIFPIALFQLKGMDIKDLVEIVILRYDHDLNFFLQDVRDLGK